MTFPNQNLDVDDPWPTGPARAQSYSFRVPSPPRIFVPPPSINVDGKSNVKIVQDTVTEAMGSGFENTDFLKNINFDDFENPIQVLEWKYEHRRQAQKILPFMYLGPMSVAKDKKFLESENVTMVLAVRNVLSAQARLLGSQVARELGIEFQTVDVADNQQLIAGYPRGIDIINAHLTKQHRSQGIQDGGSSKPTVPGNVLVFCESGNERSATLVVAYIMAMFSAPLLKAVQYVQAHRFAVAFDDPLRNLLATYESILIAKRDIVNAEQQRHTGAKTTHNTDMSEEIGSFGTKTKRRLDEADEDAEMDDTMDYGHSTVGGHSFGRREGHAPFQDGRHT